MQRVPAITQGDTVYVLQVMDTTSKGEALTSACVYYDVGKVIARHRNGVAIRITHACWPDKWTDELDADLHYTRTVRLSLFAKRPLSVDSLEYAWAYHEAE
jgi:hypothetical protein